MASLDFVKKRIDGAEKKLEKLNRKMERIQVAKASNYELNNPYCYGEYDLISTEREIKIAEKSLKKYREQLRQETEKAESRNVSAINDFLDKWLVDCIKFFENEEIKYQKALKEHRKLQHEYVERFNKRNQTPEERKADAEDNRKRNERFKNKWSHVTQFNHGSLSWHETMIKDLETEKIRKYDDIIERTNKIVGKITSAENLSISPEGNLNGIIEGTKGNAKVNTIGAGGYNIQCYHFRTLINEI